MNCLIILISVLVILLAVVLVLLLIPVKASIHFTKNSETLKSQYVVTVAGIKILTSEKRQNKTYKHQETKQTLTSSKRKIKIKDIIGIYNNNTDDIMGILSYASENALRFENIEIELSFGTGNAAATGISYGIISGIIYSMLGVIDTKCDIVHHKIDIIPDFNESVFKTECKCIVKLKNVHIIVIAVKLLLLMLKIRKFTPDGNNEENTTLAKEGKECDNHGRSSY